MDKHIRQYKAQGEHGFPSAKLEMIRESLEAEFLFNERLKKHYKVLLAIEILWLFPVSMNPDPEGGCRVHCRWFFHSSRNDFRRFDLGQHRRRKHFRYGQWHSKRNDQCQRRFWGTSKWKCKRKYRCRWGNPYRLYGRSRDSS